MCFVWASLALAAFVVAERTKSQVSKFGLTVLMLLFVGATILTFVGMQLFELTKPGVTA